MKILIAGGGEVAESNYIIIKIEKFQLCFTICFDTTKHSFLNQLETTMQ